MSAKRVPKYGDEVFVPSGHEDGSWANGIVNSVRDGQMLVACTGHRHSNLVLARVAEHGADWCWPEDVGATPSGSKPSPMEEVEG